MLRRLLLLATAVLCCSQNAVLADQEPVTPDQIVARYLDAIGAERFSSITTFIERGEIQNTITNPNVANLGRLSSPLTLPQHERYEYYFKSPNLRFRSTISENNQVMGLHGCDGNVTWYIDPSLKRQEFTPKPGREYDCEKGFENLSFRLRDAHTKLRLAGKKKVGGRMAWEIKVKDPQPQGPDTYYFDAETYLLLRYGRQNKFVTLSDYREVGGIKRPFTIILEDGYGRAITTVREVQINVPINDSRFAEPQVKNGMISLNPVLPPRNAEAQPPAPSTPNPTEPAPAAAAAPSIQINYPNFTTCTIAELQTLVPELRQLKPTADQSGLQPLLDKIGVKLLDTARNTPNLISHEVVTDSAKGAVDRRREYDYLILTHVEGAEIDLNEFRVDLKTGEKFQVDYVKPGAPNDAQATAAATSRPGQQPAASETGRHPLSQGFASSWVYFFPRNQPQSAFRYLGEQKLKGHRSVVLAFAQKPEAVRSPGLFRYQGRSIPMYFQGVAWFDARDFRILRIRTELLSPLLDISLERLSAEIQFVETRIPNLSSTLFLPRDVDVVSVAGGGTIREHLSYSDYRLFRAESRILLNP
jgi:outer membrane lipoprotein-sorting protein